jgi:hypothetical protein
MLSAGAPGRPAWMDIPLEPENLAKYGLRLRPVVVRSLIGAGYRQLGDLCWASGHELRKLFYVGRKTARQIRTAIRQLQTSPFEGGDRDGSAREPIDLRAPVARRLTRRGRTSRNQIREGGLETARAFSLAGEERR